MDYSDIKDKAGKTVRIFYNNRSGPAELVGVIEAITYHSLLFVLFNEDNPPGDKGPVKDMEIRIKLKDVENIENLI